MRHQWKGGKGSAWRGTDRDKYRAGWARVFGNSSEKTNSSDKDNIAEKQ